MKGLKKRLKQLHRYLKKSRQELTRLEVENTMPSQGPQSKFRKNLSAVIGLFILCMAVIGVIFSSLYFYNIRAQKEEAQYLEKVTYYQNFIAPVVSLDMGEFVNLDNANNLTLLIPSFFKAQQSVYANIEERASVSGGYIIHGSEVNAAAKQLFGREVILQPFTLDGLRFQYVENEKYFLSPLTLRLQMYTPEITAITPTEKGVDLTVKYVEIAAEQDYKVGKTMKISLEGEYKKEIITAITAVE